jgi:hypothetical protein
MTFMTFATPYILWFAFVGFPIAPGVPAPPFPFSPGGAGRITHFPVYYTLHYQLAKKYEKGLTGNQPSP